MATKCITITTEAYNRLKARKKGNESFTDVICKLTGKRSLLELAGILSDKEAREIKKNIKENRKRADKRAREIAEVFA